MSLRTSKVGLLRSGLKNLNSGGLNCYCTKTRTFDDKKILFVATSAPQRLSNEILGTNPTFPFQGGIGFDKTQIKLQKEPALKEKKHFKALSLPTTSDGSLRYQLRELPEIIENSMRIQVAPDYQPEEPIKIEVMKADRAMELKAVPCPKTLKKDLKNLFLDIEIEKTKNITVLNLTQKSVTDMSAWSPEMEAEREALTKDFINVAIAVCHDLQKIGNGMYWADFIEPASGRPYFGKYTNACLFETDDKYRDLGFKIEDLGCCKVIKHVKWSTNAFVGSIFTDASIDSAEVKTILANAQAGQYFQEKSSALEKSE
jgi:hypothetical protein